MAHLWAILPLALAWFTSSIDYIEPYDFWWNVKSGEIMAKTGRFLGTDVLVWTPVRLPYSNPQWGSQLIFYWFYNLSPYLVLTLRVMIITAAMALLLRLIFRKTGSLRIASVVTLIAYCTGWTNYGMRPQLLAFLPFMAFLFILEQKDAHPRRLLLLAPIMFFWVNVHGSFFLGVALMAIYALGTIVEKLGTPEERTWLVSKAAVWQLGGSALALLATLANPYVVGIYDYFFTATNDPIARALNIEWQPPTIYEGTGILFYTNVLLFLASLYISKRRLRPTEILLVLAFGYLSLTSLRNVLWWGWVTAPIMAANIAVISSNRAARKAALAEYQSPTADAEPPVAQRVEVPALNWVIAALLVGGVLAFTPLWRLANPLVPDDAAHALADNTPVKLANFLTESQPPRPLFNYMEWGGYLEWELYDLKQPEQDRVQMFIDGRFEARRVEVWHDYLTISRARADWQKTLDNYRVNTLVLNKEFHADLIRTIAAAPGSIWHTSYEDKMGVVYVRR